MIQCPLRSCIQSVLTPLLTMPCHQLFKKASVSLATVSVKPFQIQRRFLFLQWLNSVSNKVDRTRIEEVGPDRACAEWLLRNGALVQWVGSSSYVTEYNELPLRGAVKGRYLIKTVDATESSIMALGFPHFEGCTHIEKIILKKCGYLHDDALPFLSALKGPLRTLEIVYCWNLTPEGLLPLSSLTNLTTLKVEGMSAAKGKAEVEQKLKSSLPHCEISFIK